MTSTESSIQAIRNGLVSGSVASVASTISLSILGKMELDKLAAPVNGPSQWFWGRRAPFEDSFSLRHTIVGFGIHHATSIFWAIWYEKLRQSLPPAQNAPAVLAPAVATAAAAYFVDFHVVPKRLTPGFENRLSKRSLLVVYGTFALGLASIALLEGNRGAFGNSRRKKPTGPTR